MSASWISVSIRLISICPGIIFSRNQWQSLREDGQTDDQRSDNLTSRIYTVDYRSLTGYKRLYCFLNTPKQQIPCLALLGRSTRHRVESQCQQRQAGPSGTPTFSPSLSDIESSGSPPISDTEKFPACVVSVLQATYARQLNLNAFNALPRVVTFFVGYYRLNRRQFAFYHHVGPCIGQSDLKGDPTMV